MRIYLLLLVFLAVLNFSAAAQPHFTVYTSGNPVVAKGSVGSWDVGGVWSPKATVFNDTVFMIYNGTQNFGTTPVKLGLAISTDGYNFIKYPANPILSGDGSGFDSYNVSDAVLFRAGETWYLYYTGLQSPPDLPGNVISRATAANPRGPWTRSNDTLLAAGSNGEWDDRLITAVQILTTDTGLVMYYWGADDWWDAQAPKFHIGMATSIDGGQTWKKYNDPATTSAPFAESDPILKAGDSGSYDDGVLGATILHSSEQWEMFYANESSNDSLNGICYATSMNGIEWQKHAVNPIISYRDDPLAIIGVLECPSAVIYKDSVYMYYDYGPPGPGIGLVAGPITGIYDVAKIPVNFYLKQNYPNPFNPTTNIEFSMDKAGWVSLKIYSLLGQEVAALVSEKLNPGTYNFTWDASGYASGIYYCTLSTPDFRQMKKMVLIR